jgi:hypothetical protein
MVAVKQSSFSFSVRPERSRRTRCKRSRFRSRDQPGYLVRIERAEILERLADADGVDRQAELLRRRDQHAAFRRAVQLGHHQPGDAGVAAEHLDLVERILAGGGIEHQHHVVRRGGVEPPQHAADLGELVHQPGLVLQAPGSIDDQHVGADRGALLDAFPHQPGGVGAFLAGDDRHADPLGPHLQLADRGGAERVAGDEHHLIILLLQQVRELGDRRRLARSVDADDEDHLRARESLDLKRLGDGPEYLRHLVRHHGADAGLVYALVVALVLEPLAHPCSGGRAEIGGD